MRFVTCLTQMHDLRLVVLAVALCAFGSMITVRLYMRARQQELRTRAAWIFLGAVAGGSMVWCTHFVGILAYRPGAEVAYEPFLTALSLGVAVVGIGLALVVGSARFPLAPEVGGALFGASVAVMHYTGMEAFRVEALSIWDTTYVAASLLLAVGFGTLAFSRAARPIGRWCRYGAATAMVLAVGALHFTAMAALTIMPLAPHVGAATGETAQHALAGAVAGVALLVLGTGAASYLLDQMSRDRSAARLRYLVDVAVDGMIVEQDGRVVEVNSAMSEIVGRARQALLGTTVASMLEPGIRLVAGKLVRTMLVAGSQRIPVEVAYRREPTHPGAPAVDVYAVRDLRPRLEQERRLADLAANDVLTGLPNRASFLTCLEETLGERDAGSSVALLSIDLDAFKETNDLHGHDAGDEVLRVQAERMRAALAGGALLARSGADEFAVLAAPCEHDAALALATLLRDALAPPVPVGDSTIAGGAAIGIALFPQDARTPTMLMNNADLATQRAKASHDERVCFYLAATDDAVRARRKITTELRDALAHGEFELRYQVQCSVATGQVTGYEALIRWRHPERGYVSPAEFIPVAEETGLIVPIGEWVLGRACSDAVRWPGEPMVAVNLSAVQLGQADLPGLVRRTLQSTGLDPRRLELEITETAMIADPERTTRILREIKALGVSIAMDDFGTGYSSLSTLGAFPFDKIKLDRSFMLELDSGPQAGAVIRAVLTLGTTLGIPVLAEGVETDAQLAFLRSQGCDEAQGYLLGKPGAGPSPEPDTKAAADALHPPPERPATAAGPALPAGADPVRAGPAPKEHEPA